MDIKKFKAESKRLLDLMIHSIYTHKEIFMRELISNASDAIDKLYYQSLSSDHTGLSRDDFYIRLTVNRKNRTLTISDNGAGMSKEELENNLGTIARSGSLAFKQENLDAKDEIDIIGQFGVGFYSAFMVSDKVTVISRAHGSDQAFCWESNGAEGYTVQEAEKEGNGTDIILHLKEDNDDERYEEYLDEYRIQGLIKKYSDYIRYPIKMDMTKSRMKEKAPDAPEDAPAEFEEYTETETLNSMIPLWKRSKSELTAEAYNNFYKDKFFDFTDPSRVIHTNVEGVVSYNALLFIPGKAPFNYYTRDYEKGLQLYSSGVMIMDKCADLLPDYFSFVKGLVDSQDLSLNISREMLQHDRQLKAIASRLEKKIKSELLEMQEKDRESYDQFYKNFGLQLKYGVYEGYGSHKELLQDLLMFYSSSEKKPITLKEYLSRMKEEQKYIYYACGSSVERIEKLPQTELLLEKGMEILYLTDDIDEFALQMMKEYEGKEFKSASSEDLGVEESEEEKEEAKKQAEENKDLLTFMKEALGDRVNDVRLSQRLKTHPVCLASGDGLSLDMEKVLNAMPVDEKVKAERVLEINASHPILSALQKTYAGNPEQVKVYAEILYNQALLIEGMPIEDPVAFSNAVCGLIV